MRKNALDIVSAWLKRARRDLLAAEWQLRAAEPFTDIVCFHAQQAAEKYVEAYVTFQKVALPRTHAVEDLVLLAAECDADFKALVDDAAVLTPCVVERRYPEFEQPSI